MTLLLSLFLQDINTTTDNTQLHIRAGLGGDGHREIRRRHQVGSHGPSPPTLPSSHPPTQPAIHQNGWRRCPVTTPPRWCFETAAAIAANHRPTCISPYLPTITALHILSMLAILWGACAAQRHTYGR